MNNITENMNFLKNFVKRRETYIRFSPTGTWLMGLLYILYYFFWYKITSFIPDTYVFLGIGIISIIIVTIMSMINSERKWEEILPSSIRYIIINLFFIACSYFLIVGSISYLVFEHIVGSAFIFYGLLIIVSRMSLPEYIKYFGLVIFILGALIIGPLASYTPEIILVWLWVWHLVMAIFLKINNDKDG